MKQLQYVVFLAVLAAFGCKKSSEAHWSYEGDHGPAHWGEMKSEFASCKIGQKQSPIDIKTTDTRKEALPAIEFNYKKGPARALNNGHTVQVNFDPGNFIEIEGRKYNLAQFHFHAPAEEKVNGEQFELVAHLVHKNDQGELAVVGVLFEVGDPNESLQRFWPYLPREENKEAALPVEINPADLLPEARGYYTYEGSLTTPPCSEGVRWLVLKTPVSISERQKDAFRAIYRNNNRPVQPLNGRIVRESE